MVHYMDISKIKEKWHEKEKNTIRKRKKDKVEKNINQRFLK